VTIASAKGDVLGAAGGSTGFHQRGTQPAIAPAGLAATAFTSALMIAGTTHASPARKMRGAKKAPHIGTDFGHHDFSGSPRGLQKVRETARSEAGYRLCG